MKSLNKKEIDNIFKFSKIKPIIKDELLTTPIKIRNLSLEKKLTIIIPGKPISDSRPKNNTNLGIFYNLHKGNLMKIFARCVEDANPCDFGIIILSPMYVHTIAYQTIPKAHLKYLPKNELPFLKEENIPGTYLKDNDNIEKVHYDVLQDNKWNMIIKDDYIIKNTTEKVFIEDPLRQRVEIEIYYTNKKHWSFNILKTTKEFLGYILSIKYKLINNIPDNRWKRVFYQNLSNYFVDNPVGKNTMTRIKNTLSYYKIEELKLLENGKKKDEIIENILKNVALLLDEIKMRKKKKK